MDTRTPSLGIIGGSGLYEFAELREVERVRLTTPFGDPSDEIVIGSLGERRVAFLPRHGRGHRIQPSELNFRANIHAMKQLGVVRLVSTGAVGSLREEIVPGHLVVPDQFFDRTFGRQATFFGDGIVAHVQFGDPVCARLAGAVADAAATTGATVHRGGTYVNMEGPQFSTLAESRLYRQWGLDVIGMTNLQEAKLAREAEICYATLALVTDYDCWHPDHDSVTVEMIINNLTENAKTAQQVIATVVEQLDVATSDPAHSALATAIITRLDAIRDLAPIIGKYIK